MELFHFFNFIKHFSIILPNLHIWTSQNIALINTHVLGKPHVDLFWLFSLCEEKYQIFHVFHQYTCIYSISCKAISFASSWPHHLDLLSFNGTILHLKNKDKRVLDMEGLCFILVSSLIL